jgi:pimeloyl-ACP methyl ester carboxylesterase
MARKHEFGKCLARTCGVALVASFVLATAPGSSAGGSGEAVRTWPIAYIAHNGVSRLAYVVLPAWYGPDRNPTLPLVISPHGRGGNGRANARFWGDLPAAGQFAVINPDGMGRRFARFSYGFAGQIDDLAKMPDFAERALPWLHIDRDRIYALGTSMGGQETLLLLARHPRLLAGTAAMDSVTDLARRYHQLPHIPCDPACYRHYGTGYGEIVQATLRREVGGSPESRPRAYLVRSPIGQEAKIAQSGVSLQLWWSSSDQIVFDQKHQSARLARDLGRLKPCAPVVSYAGTWRHSQAMWAGSLLPVALAGFGLLPSGFPGIPEGGYRGSCVPTAGLSGIPRLIATGLQCRSAPGNTCT